MRQKMAEKPLQFIPFKIERNYIFCRIFPGLNFHPFYFKFLTLIRMYNILLKDDYAIYRKGINEILRSRFPYSGITEVDSAVKLADKANLQNWDIIIFDIADLSGKNFHLLSTLKQACPESRLIITTNAENPVLKNALISAGASACIAKDCSIEDFIEIIYKTIENKQAFA